MKKVWSNCKGPIEKIGASMEAFTGLKILEFGEKKSAVSQNGPLAKWTFSPKQNVPLVQWTFRNFPKSTKALDTVTRMPVKLRP